MKTSLTIATLLAGATAFAQVPRTDPAFPAPAFPTPPVTTIPPGPQTLTNFGQTNIFTGGPGPRFTNPALARITNGLTNGLFQITNQTGVGAAPGQSGVNTGGVPNAPYAPAAPVAPGAPQAPTVPGTTPVTPGVPPANPTVPDPNLPGNTPTLPDQNNSGANSSANLGVPGTPSAVGEPAPGINPLKPLNRPLLPPRAPQGAQGPASAAPPAAAPAR